MKKLFIITIILLILFTLNLNAQSEFSYKIGVNYSDFRGEDTDLELAATFGLSYEWSVKKNTTFVGEAIYTNRKGILKNRTIGSGTGYDLNVSYYDIYCSTGSIDFPLLIKYYLPISHKLKIQIIAGPSLSLCILDLSTKNRTRIESLKGNERENYDFDFTINPEAGSFYILDSSGFRINVGIGICYLFLSFEVLYSYALNETEVISNVNVNKNLNSINLLVGLSLDEILGLF